MTGRCLVKAEAPVPASTDHEVGQASSDGVARRQSREWAITGWMMACAEY